jgi:transcriptional regulator with XRE-family HTH domain
MAKSSAMDAFISNLNRIRKERGMTQADLAELLGTTQGSISRLLSGGEDVTLTRLDRIAEKLGVSRSELIEDPVLIGK